MSKSCFANFKLGFFIIGLGSCSPDDSQLHSGKNSARFSVMESSAGQIAEISGLAKGIAQDGKVWIYDVGDRTFDVGRALWTGENRPLDFQVVNVQKHFAAAGIDHGLPSQWEAVAVDGTGQVVILRENPAQIQIFSPGLTSLVATTNLTVPSSDTILSDWNSAENSQGEGFVLLKKGHILLLKEKGPLMLIEFGPAGEAALGYSSTTILDANQAFDSSAREIEPLHSWSTDSIFLNDSSDLSDLAVGPNGKLFALGDRAQILASITGRSKEEVQNRSLSPASQSFQINTLWHLPASIAKPEGLVFVDDSRPIIGSDKCKSGDRCIFSMSKIN